MRPQNQKSFRYVLNLENNKKGTVVEHLSSQFTVDYDDETFGFLFYKDRDVTWTPTAHITRVKENNNVAHHNKSNRVQINRKRLASTKSKDT